MSISKTWSPYQKAVFDFVKHGTGSAIVEATAGSGKTTTIIEATNHMAGQIAIMAFNNDIIKELNRKRPPSKKTKIATCHSFGKTELNRIAPKAELNNSKVLTIAERLLAAKYSPRERGVIIRLVALAKNSGIGLSAPLGNKKTNQEWEEIATHHGLDEDLKTVGITFKIALELATKVLKASNADLNSIDFADMLYLPLVHKCVIPTYDWVLLDEAQDTNLTRRKLARAMLKPTGRLLAVGDQQQAIYGFTGADHASLQRIKEEFSCQTLPLSISYRCAKNIIAYAQQWNPSIMARPGAEDGNVTEIDYEEWMDSLKSIKLTEENGIICRNNAPLVGLFYNLLREGIPCRLNGLNTKDLANLARKWKNVTLLEWKENIIAFGKSELEKYIAKDEEFKVRPLLDSIETILVLAARVLDSGKTTIEDLQSEIIALTGPRKGVNPAKAVLLSSIHKAKGLEWKRVFHIGEKQFLPSKFAKKEWQQTQEQNLLYVAATRAKTELYNITDVPTPKTEKSNIKEFLLNSSPQPAKVAITATNAMSDFDARIKQVIEHLTMLGGTKEECTQVAQKAHAHGQAKLGAHTVKWADKKFHIAITI